MSSIFEVGTICVVTILSFALGRFWSISEQIFINRQKAYSDFLKKAVIPSELFVLNDDELKKMVAELKEAGAAFSLYASDKANFLVGKYLGKISSIMVTTDQDEPEQIFVAFEEAEKLREQLIEQMRRDALGFSWFRIKSFFSKLWQKLFIKETSKK